MAPRGQKRAAAQASAETPGAKRIADFLRQQGVTKAEYQPVVDIVRHPLAGLPEGAHDMLLAILPWSLAVPADGRHEAQQGAVRMVDGVVEAVQAALQQRVAAEAGKVEELEANRASLQGEAERAQVAVVAANASAEACAQQLADAEAALTLKTAAVEDAKHEDSRLAEEQECTRLLMSELEEVLSGSFTTLKEGSCEDDVARAALVETVRATGSKCGLEESLASALPSSLMKRERGSFDMAVVSEIEECLRKKIAAVKETAETTASHVAAQAAALLSAESELEAAGAHRAEVVEALRSAQESSSASIAALESAKAAISPVEAKLAEANASRDAQQGQLEQFCSYNVCMYNMLRDRETPRPQGKEDAETQEQAPAEAEDVTSKVPAGEEASAGMTASLAGA